MTLRACREVVPEELTLASLPFLPPGLSTPALPHCKHSLDHKIGWVQGLLWLPFPKWAAQWGRSIRWVLTVGKGCAELSLF